MTHTHTNKNTLILFRVFYPVKNRIMNNIEKKRDSSKHFQDISIDHHRLQLLRFICLKSARRGCHIWSRIVERKLLLHQLLPSLCSFLFYGLFRIPNNRPNTVARLGSRSHSADEINEPAFEHFQYLYWLFHWRLLWLVSKRRDNANCQVHVWNFICHCFKGIWVEGESILKIKCALLNPLHSR